MKSTTNYTRRRGCNIHVLINTTKRTVHISQQLDMFTFHISQQLYMFNVHSTIIVQCTSLHNNYSYSTYIALEVSSTNLSIPQNCTICVIFTPIHNIMQVTVSADAFPLTIRNKKFLCYIVTQDRLKVSHYITHAHTCNT